MNDNDAGQPRSSHNAETPFGVLPKKNWGTWKIQRLQTRQPTAYNNLNVSFAVDISDGKQITQQLCEWRLRTNEIVQ